jgi:hypothetical protein
VKAQGRPAAGDNEYGSATCSTPGASGYVSYFGDAASPNQPGCRSACPSYYSYDLGSWHVVVLNTNCSQPGVGGCGSTSPQGPSGAADPANGVRQFIVGTGGKSLHGLSRNPDPQVESRQDSTYGILELTLHPSSYSWRFVPEAGRTFTDSGTQACH